MDLKNKKVLTVFFSHKGQNYSNGKIVDLKKGNTAVAAEIIADYTGADLFEITAVKEYPFEYNSCTTAAQEELKANMRPELLEDKDISMYDIIFVGFPNWWGTMPMPLWTFLEAHDFTGKIVLPFCTHEGSGMGKSESDLKKLAVNADIRAGLAIHGSSVDKSENNIVSWIERA